jgi:hypothetical protein
LHAVSVKRLTARSFVVSFGSEGTVTAGKVENRVKIFPKDIWSFGLLFEN